MKKKLTLISSLCILGSTMSFAAPNPASQDWVTNWVAGYASPLLSATDWSAVCTSGSLTSATGCYGDAGSSAFAKINNALRGFNIQANVTLSSVADSVFIQEYNGGSAVTTPTGDTTVYISNPTSNLLVCGIYTTEGNSLTGGDGYGFINACVPTTANASITYYGSGATVVIGPNYSGYSNLTYANDCSNGATAMPITLPFYLVCLGRDSTTGAPVSLSSITATSGA